MCNRSSPNTPSLPPQTLHKLRFLFVEDITVVPREVEDDAYANVRGGGGKQGVWRGEWRAGLD